MFKLYKIYVQFDYMNDTFVNRFAKSKWFKKEPKLHDNLLVVLDKEIINVIVSDIDKQRKIIFVKTQPLKVDEYEAFQKQRENQLQSVITRIRIIEDKLNKLTYQKKQEPMQEKQIDIVKADISKNALNILEQLNNGIN